MRTLLALAVVALAQVATAAHLPAVLFEPGTDLTTTRVLGSDATYVATLPRCDASTFPCRTTITKHWSPRLWEGGGAPADGVCEGPVVYPIIDASLMRPGTRLAVLTKAADDCSIRVRVMRRRLLRFPTSRGYQPLVTLDFGNMTMGVFFQPNVAKGFKIDRVIFARGAMRKQGVNLARNSAGMYIREQFGVLNPQPAVFTTSWIIDSSVSGSAGNPWKKYQSFPYTPQVTSAPFQVAAELVGTFQNNTGKFHWSDVLSAVGAFQQKTFRCTQNGVLAVGATFVCELHFNNTTQPSPI